MLLKFAVRNIYKRPFLNLIKVIGLSLALSSILIIVLFLKNELTYDGFYKKSERIYRLTYTSSDFFEGKHFARICKPDFIPKMSEYFPEIENYLRLAPIYGGTLKHNEEFIKISQAYICDSTFFQVFDSELLVGNPENILNGPGSMVVSESFAKRTFGKENPIGQILTLPEGQFYGEIMEFTIKGIMKDFPQNSHFHPECLTSPIDKTIFEGSWAWTYLLLNKNANPDNIIKGFKEFIFSFREIKTPELKIEAHLENIKDIHLHSKKLREIEANSNISVIYTLSIAALLLLFISITNYSNLNIGMADFSNKYLFISQVLGSSKWTSIKYFLFEGIIIVMSSAVITVFIVTSSINLIQKYYALNLFTGNMLIILTVMLLFSLLGVLSGILPEISQGISKIRSSADYNYSTNFRRKGINKSLIVLQYTISIALIVAVLVISRQTTFALNSSMGVEDSNLICFENVHSNVQLKFGLFKEELLKYNSVQSVSAMLEPPGGEANDMFQFKMEGYIPKKSKKAEDMIGVFPCDYSFASIFRLKFLSGNNFTENNEDNEGSGEYIINKSAMKRLNYTNPNDIIGKAFQLIVYFEGIHIPAGKIIGVVDDFHLSTIKKEVEPLVMFKRKDLWLINFVLSYRPGMQTEALSDIKSVWTKMFPEYPFQYEHISSMYRNVYKTEILQFKLLSIFTFIALFICSMGLLGLSLLTTQRRTKEVGLRKINGARTGQMMVMLNWDFIKWTIISFVLAVPIAYIAMTKWLENFAYKTTLSWWIFFTAGCSAILIAIVTVSLQSWKASSRNPVEALRYE
jgi:putative ABC transport system permease protein